MKDKIVKILEEYVNHYHSYYNGPGYSVDEYEKVAEDIMALFNCENYEEEHSKGGI